MSSMRFSCVFVSLGLSLAACEASEGLLRFQAGGAYVDASVSQDYVLRPDEESESLRLGLGLTRSVGVVVERTSDRTPVSSTTVAFVLEGDAGGASLRELTVTTDDKGLARTLLSAGSQPGSFEVRATANRAAPLRIPVTVLEPDITALEVQLPYAGQRDVRVREVQAFSGTSCDELSMQGPESTRAPEATRTPFLVERWEDDAEGIELSVDVNRGKLTLVGYARGPFDNAVARACRSVDPMLENTSQVTLSLIDLPVRMEGAYDVVAGLSVETSINRVAQALVDDAETVLIAPASTSAARLLNALENTLRADGRDADALTVAQLRASTTEPTLAAQLEQALDDTGGGFEALLSRLSTEVLARGAQLEVEAQLAAVGTSEVDLSYAPVALTASDAEAEQPLTLWFGVERDQSSVAGSIGADFDGARSLMTIDTLRIDLGLGTYGSALVHALTQQQDADLVATLREVSGCNAFDDWVRGHEELQNLCNAGCSARACQLAIDDLIDDSGEALTALNESHPSIGLRGEVPVHDLDEDGVADQVEEASLSGSWGRAPEENSADMVDGTLLSIYVP